MSALFGSDFLDPPLHHPAKERSCLARLDETQHMQSLPLMLDGKARDYPSSGGLNSARGRQVFEPETLI